MRDVGWFPCFSFCKRRKSSMLLHSLRDRMHISGEGFPCHKLMKNMRYNWSETARIEVIYCEPLKCVIAVGDLFFFALPMVTSSQTNISETKLDHPSKQSGHVEWKRQHTARRSLAVSCLAAGGATVDSILILPPKPPLHSLCAGDATLVSIWSCTQGRVEKNTANDIFICILCSSKEDRAGACVHERGVEHSKPPPRDLTPLRTLIVLR